MNSSPPAGLLVGFNSSNNSQRLSCGSLGGSSGGAYTPFMPRHVSFDERSSGAPASGSLPGYSCRVSASSPGSSCAGGGSGGSGPRDASSPKAIAMRWLESSRVSLARHRRERNTICAHAECSGRRRACACDVMAAEAVHEGSVSVAVRVHSR